MNLWCGGWPRARILVHRESPGRPGCKAGVAQWLGPRPGRRSEAGDTRFDSRRARIVASHDEPGKLGYVTSRNPAPGAGIQTENTRVM